MTLLERTPLHRSLVGLICCQHPTITRCSNAQMSQQYSLPYAAPAWSSGIWQVQVKVAARPLAGSPGGSPQGALAGDSPSSQGQSSAAGSPWSPVSSPDWHTTPRWPQFANFGAHSSRPINPSTLSQVTSASPAFSPQEAGTPDSQVNMGHTFKQFAAGARLT